MGLSFDYPPWAYARSQTADWLIGATQISFALWCRFDTIEAPANYQYVWSHRGADGAHGLRLNTDGKFRIVTYTGGTYVNKSSTVTPSEDTVYHVMGSWKINDASGLRMWVDGSEQGTATSTTSQSGTYQPGTANNLWLGVYSANSNAGRCSVEGLIVVRDYLWTDNDVAELQHTGYPWCFAWAGNDHCFYPCWGVSPGRIPDWSGNGRHMEPGDITGTPTDGGIMGQWYAPWMAGGSLPLDTTTGATPQTWTEFGSGTLHPETEETVTGLSNGTTYEFIVRAEDQAGNLSAESVIVEATPQSYLKHFTRNVWWPWRTDVSAIPTQNLVEWTGFESGGADEIDRIYNNAEFTTAYKRSGLYGLRLYPSGATGGYTQHTVIDEYGIESNEFNSARLYASYWVHVTTLPTSSNEQCAKIENTGYSQMLELRLRPDGKLDLYNTSGTLVDTGSIALAAGSDYDIDIYCEAGSAGAYEVRINGVSDMSGTANFGTTNCGVLLLGRFNNRNSETYDIVIDDVRIDTLNWPVALKVRALAPTATGSSDGWAALSGDKWDNLSDVPGDDDTTYIYSSTTSDAYLARFATLAQAGLSGKTIVSLKPIIDARKATASSTDLHLQIKSGATTLNTVPGSLSQSTYDCFQWQMNVDPNTGEPWTEAGVNALEAGPVKEAETNPVRCSQALLFVAYLD